MERTTGDGPPPAAAEAGAGGTFGALLAKLRAFIPCELIGGPEWDGLLARIGGLPEEGVASKCGFEFRLGAPAAAADFFVAVGPEEFLAQHYIRQGTADGAHRAAAALARHLVRMDPSRGDSVASWNDSITLEYDLAETGEGAGSSAPGVFLRMRLAHLPDAEDPHRCRPRNAAAGTAAAGIAAAVGWVPDEWERRAVERAFDALPAGGKVAHVGALPGRAPRAVRILAQRLDRADVSGYLERLHWPGDFDRAVSVLSDFADVCPRFRLSVDVSARGTSPRLGVELFVREQWGPEDNWLSTDIGHWRSVVERLEASGLCLAEKARGLRAWPGARQLYGASGVHLLYMGINHVKLLIEHGEVRAKAYTGLHCAPSPPRG